MKNRPETGRALFYTRDSGGEHETTPGEYVGWAIRRAREFGVSFDGTADQISAMIGEGRFASGDLFIDYGVKGNVLSRKGLDALFKVALHDTSVTHVFIPRRDRLARPDDPMDAVQMENLLRRSGITLVFMDRTWGPIGKRQRMDLADLIVSLVDYDKSGRERRELAQKIIYAQLKLAKTGFSTGGRPPFGFRRWLARDDGTQVRELADKERVRIPGHHVVWLPGPETQVAVIRRILEMLKSIPASRVAAILTAEGVPSPDHDRWRTDRGIKHKTSGVWHQSVIVGIARNSLLRMVATYGRRSMGDQLRFTPDGPRELCEADHRADGKPKVASNPHSARIQQLVPVNIEPIVDPAVQDTIIAILDARAGTQRGKPRSHDPDKNPLGGQVFDMNCGWPMYREPYNESFRYKCGFYQQSHGAKCDHNHVAGPVAVRFLLNCLRQRLLSPTLLPKLEGSLRDIAQREISGDRLSNELVTKQALLDDLNSKQEKVKRNMSFAETQEQWKAMASVFDDLERKRTDLEGRIKTVQHTSNPCLDIDAEICAAMNLAQRLSVLAADENNFSAIGEIFRQVNVRLFLRFAKAQVGKRRLNKLVSGVVTFGSAPPPVEVYNGPTARSVIKGSATAVAAEPRDSGSPGSPKPSGPGREGESLGNGSRGDWIRTSDLLNPIQEPMPPNPLQHIADASNASSRCTTGCTSEPKADHGDPLAQLATALKALSPEDRARLAAILQHDTGEGGAEMGTP